MYAQSIQLYVVYIQPVKGKMMKVVYFCHPYSGSPKRNRQKIIDFLQTERIDFEQYCLIVPQLYLYHYIRSEKTAMSQCLELLKRCDEVWVVGRRISKGMRKELRLTEVLGKEVKFFKGGNYEQKEGNYRTGRDRGKASKAQ